MSGSTAPHVDSASPWRIYAANVMGRQHATRQEPGQDRFDVWTRTAPRSGRSILVTVTADGAGSAGKSWAGAWAACRSIRQSIDAVLPEERFGGRAFHAEFWTDKSIERLFAKAVRRLDRWSRAVNAAPQDLATTLNLALIGDDFARFGRIGDGILGYSLSAKDGDWQVAIPPDIGEFASETSFLTSPAWRDRLRITSLDQSPRRVVVATDGIGPILFDSRAGTIHSRFMNPLFEALERNGNELTSPDLRLARFLGSDRVAKFCSDDLTVVMARRDEGRPEVDESSEDR